jgi:hypothetical protein
MRIRVGVEDRRVAPVGHRRDDLSQGCRLAGADRISRKKAAMNVIDTVDLDEIIRTSIREAIIAAMPHAEAMLRVIYNAHYDATLVANGLTPPRS